MKNILTSIYVCTAIAALCWLCAGCNNRSSDDISPTSGCRLQNYSLTEGSGFSLREEQATYTYDAQGNLLKADTTWTIQGNADGTNRSNSTATGNFVYSSEGFMTAFHTQRTMQTTLGMGKVDIRQYSLNASYTYTNERITGYIYKTTGYFGQKTTMTVVGNYEYDGAGNLSKQKATITYEYEPNAMNELPAYQSGFQRTWLYADNQLVDYTEKDGTTETHPYTLQNGLVTKVTYPDNYTTYEYDNEKRLTKSEIYTHNDLNSYYTLEWSDGKQALAAIPLFKGFPEHKPAFGEAGVLKKFNYYANTGNKMEQMNESTYQNQINQWNFLTNVTLENKQINPGASSMVINRTQTYTYTGCN